MCWITNISMQFILRRTNGKETCGKVNSSDSFGWVHTIDTRATFSTCLVDGMERNLSQKGLTTEIK